MIDIIILSNGLDQYFREMTQTCINSCHASEETKFNIIVYEQTDAKYKNCTTINYDIPFHYNRLMNMGIESTNNPYICLCNNDLIFHKGWATECLELMKDYGVWSCSPSHKTNTRAHKNERWVRGYRIGIGGEVKGWCILCDRRVFDVIGKIDESVSFWYSDHVYAEQLEKHNISHILALNARVDHLFSKTLKEVPLEINHELTDKQQKIYNGN